MHWQRRSCIKTHASKTCRALLIVDSNYMHSRYFVHSNELVSRTVNRQMPQSNTMRAFFRNRRPFRHVAS